MFDIYRDEQPIAVSIFEKALKEDKLSHAYLIDTNNYSLAYDLILCFVKEIFCIDIRDDIERKNIFSRIDNGNYTELEIIEADGNWIKKDQMSGLQNNFSLKAIESKRRIYIIKDCDKMNIQTSNSILKFLEEPEENIIAILISNNISKLLSTIVSRCQFIRFINDRNIKNNAIDNLCDMFCSNFIDKERFLNEIKNKNLIVNFIQFIKKFEKEGVFVIVDIKKIWHDIFDNRNYVEIALNLWINFYYDVLMIKNDMSLAFFVDYLDDVMYVSEINSIDKILRKLEVLIDAKSNYVYNLNTNLFIDKLIIDLVGES